MFCLAFLSLHKRYKLSVLSLLAPMMNLLTLNNKQNKLGTCLNSGVVIHVFVQLFCDFFVFLIELEVCVD